MLLRNVLFSKAKRDVKTEVVRTYFPGTAAVCHLRISNPQLLLQPLGTAVRWQQRKEVILRSNSRRTYFLLVKCVVGKLNSYLLTGAV